MLSGGTASDGSVFKRDSCGFAAGQFLGAFVRRAEARVQRPFAAAGDTLAVVVHNGEGVRVDRDADDSLLTGLETDALKAAEDGVRRGERRGLVLEIELDDLVGLPRALVPDDELGPFAVRPESGDAAFRVAQAVAEGIKGRSAVL